MKKRLIQKFIMTMAQIAPRGYFSRQAKKPQGYFGKIVMANLFEAGNAALIDFMLSLCSLESSDRVLDIGFGPGNMFQKLRQKCPEGMISGIDYSKDMCALANKSHAELIKKGGLEIKCESIEKISYPDNHFNAILSANTIYFWPEPVNNAKEVRRILKPKGKFVVGFRNSSQLDTLNLDPAVFKHYTSDEVIKILNGAGFESVEIKSKKENSFDSYAAVACK